MIRRAAAALLLAALPALAGVPAPATRAEAGLQTGFSGEPDIDVAPAGR